GSGRYIIHELLRQYLVEKLCDHCGNYDPVRDLHCAYFAEFMQRQEGRLKGSEQKSALAEIDAELDNLRHAWSWAVEQEKRDMLGKLVEGLFLYYQMRSLVREGLELFRKAIHRLEGVKDSLLADFYIYTAWFEAIAGWRAPWHPIQGKYETAANLYQIGVSLLRSDSGDTTILPLSGINFLDRLWDEEWVPLKFTAVQRLFQERLSQYRAGQNRWGEAWAFLCLGNLSLIRGQKDDASRFISSSLDIFRSLGDRWGSTWPMYLLGTLAHDENRYTLAHQLLEETLHICQDIGDQGGAAYLLGHLGIVTAAEKAYEESQVYLIAAVEKSYQTRWEFETAWHLMDLADVLVEAGNLEQAVELYSFLNVFPPFTHGRENVERKLKELAHRIPEGSFEMLRVRGEAHSMESIILAVKNEFVLDGGQAPEPLRQVPSGSLVKLSPIDPLTERELAVLELVAEGFSNREIAERLVVTVGTAKKHINNIFRKLQVQSRTQAAARLHSLNINPHIHPSMDDKSTL
ncbi:MAG: DNA-binding response regulator, partial [Chloroflexi bacterium]